MGAPWRTAGINIAIDRSRPIPITTQIASTLRSAIAEGRLKPGARLPSWLDLAAQLGVSRGTVKTAYDALVDEMLRSQERRVRKECAVRLDHGGPRHNKK